MLRGLLAFLNPIHVFATVATPMCWVSVWYDGEYEQQTNTITGKDRHRLTAYAGGQQIVGPWMDGPGPIDLGPQDLDLLLSPADMARRFAPLNIPPPTNER